MPLFANLYHLSTDVGYEDYVNTPAHNKRAWESTESLNAAKEFIKNKIIWAAPSEFGTYRLCEQRRFRRACASAQSRQNLRCSLIQTESQEEPSDRKPDPWPLWMAGHAQLKFVMTECSKTQIRLTGLICRSEKPHETKTLTCVESKRVKKIY